MGLLKEDLNLKIPMGRNFDPKDSTYDAIIIGAGMSGMAAAIRLAMYDKKVLLLERHTISGGLNSYYNRRKRSLDVGLHALTNFAAKRERGKPLTKLLKQLRIPYEDLCLSPQFESRVQFPEVGLRFSNERDLLISEVIKNFPHEKDNFTSLLTHIENFNEVALDNKTVMAKDEVRRFIKDPLLVEMIFCPLLIYGSAWENDMDFSQFVIMFKSIFLEGFGRSRGGVRRILELLRKRLEEVGAEVCYRNGVKAIHTQGGKVVSIETDRGQILKTNTIFSCAGYPETLALINKNEALENLSPRVGRLSFTETIISMDKRPRDFGLKDTIIFHNDQNHYDYQRPQNLFDNHSAVLCLPNNFQDDDYDEGVFRLTMMANYPLWRELKDGDTSLYNEKKNEVLEESLKIFEKYMPGFNKSDITFSDVFSPTTVERYTGHLGGCVYGSPDKSRDGTTPYRGLFLCGTDQGFLGIIGSMLSGISMANLHGLMPSAQSSAEDSQVAPTAPL